MDRRVRKELWRGGVGGDHGLNRAAALIQANLDIWLREKIVVYPLLLFMLPILIKKIDKCKPLLILILVTFISILTASVSNDAIAVTFDKEAACKILHSKLDRPKIRSERMSIGHYTDILTAPQLKSECTHTHDSGIPDPSTCKTYQDGTYDTGIPDPLHCNTTCDVCGQHIPLPLGGWTCAPSCTTKCDTVKAPKMVTKCSNIIACDTYKNYKKVMNCDITFQYKLPNFVEKPINEFINDVYEPIEDAKKRVSGSLPLECAPKSITTSKSSNKDTKQAIADYVTNEFKKRIQETLQKQIDEWVRTTAIQTIASAIPTGGLGGAAALSTSIGKFVVDTYNALKPIMEFTKDAKDFGEDIGFDTSCGWSDWQIY